jgi:hypothetical protein
MYGEYWFRLSRLFPTRLLTSEDLASLRHPPSLLLPLALIQQLFVLVPQPSSEKSLFYTSLPPLAPSASPWQVEARSPGNPLRGDPPPPLRLQSPPDVVAPAPLSPGVPSLWPWPPPAALALAPLLPGVSTARPLQLLLLLVHLQWPALRLGRPTIACGLVT